MITPMTTRLTHTLSYAAPLPEVAAMLADSAFRDSVCQTQGALRYDVSCAGLGSGLQVHIQQVWRTEGVPPLVKKFIGDEIEIVQTERWTTPTAAAVAMTIPGKPAEISGSRRLSEASGTTRDEVVIDIAVGVPFVGGKVEAMVADLLRAALSVENERGRTWLAG